jgi:hypothetical protein
MDCEFQAWQAKLLVLRVCIPEQSGTVHGPMMRVHVITCPRLSAFNQQSRYSCSAVVQ